MTQRVAIIGGGIAGVTAAWQLAQLARAGADVEAQVFESSGRLGGTIETVHKEGFTIECGPDAWVTEKPWARDLVGDLGLSEELLPSNDASRKTHIFLNGHLETMPDGMRMMVPTDLESLNSSKIFTASAKRAYNDELTRAIDLKRAAPLSDESVASFTRRHFGEEVLTRIAAPLLGGVLGGDVERLSVQAVMPQFVAMERQHGSLIAALQSRSTSEVTAIFTTLRRGLSTLIDRLVEDIPSSWINVHSPVATISRLAKGWSLRTHTGGEDEIFDAVFLAVPPHVARKLLQPIDGEAANLMQMEASTAIIVALGYLDAQHIKLPSGFGFLVPASNTDQILACTFVDQKFGNRVPVGGRLLRIFFGSRTAEALLDAPDEQLSVFAQQEVTRILGALPKPALTLVRRWPQSLPQYAVGHLCRLEALDSRIARLPGIRLLGNAYRGVGLPDLIRDARAAARSMVPS